MTPEQTTLAKQLVAHPRWRWAPGIVYTRTMWTDQRAMVWWILKNRLGSIYLDGGDIIYPDKNDHCLPDLLHPATTGALLDTLMEAIGTNVIVHLDAEVHVFWPGSDGTHASACLGEALVKALLEAWSDKEQ